MNPAQVKPKTVSEFIKAAPRESRAHLREIRACIRKAAPGAKEGLKWGMPAYTDRRILVMFAGYRHHVGFYPTSSAIRAFKKDLAGYKTSTGSIQFPLDRPLPKSLIRKITLFRVRDATEGNRRWRS